MASTRSRFTSQRPNQFLANGPQLCSNGSWPRLKRNRTGKAITASFERIRPVLLGREASPSYAAIAADLGVSESRIKVAVHRYCARFRLLLRAEIARTLDDPAEIEDEITTLIAALTA